MKRFIALITLFTMCFSLIACGNINASSGNNTPPANSDNTHETPQSTSQLIDIYDNISVSDSTSISAASETNSIITNSFLPSVLTYADFEVADYHNTGYHNVVDYFMANPNGTGNTFTECGISVFYSAAEADLVGDEALAYKTPRGIGIGDSVDNVLGVYGNITIEDVTESEAYRLLAAGQRKITAADYKCRISSGACPRIMFIFDQDNKVIHISMSAVYKKFTNEQVLATALPYN